MDTSRSACEARDADDPLAFARERFLLEPGTIYLDGNSLGPLTWAAKARVASVVEEEWGRSLIRGWTRHGWIDLSRKVGDKVGRLIGAEPGAVLAVDTTSINLFKLLSAALALRPGRRVILSDKGNFPTDLYIAQGLRALLDGRHELQTVAPEDVAGAIDGDTAVVMLTQVDYRTGRLHDMEAVNAAARAAGALTLWDLAHSAGALPIDLSGTGADLAIGCGYKYLNGGPGAPAFLYVRPGLQGEASSPLWGWLGHAAPFAFDPDYRPAEGIERFVCSTPAILSLSALDAALDAFEGVSMAELRRKSVALCESFIAAVEAYGGEHGLVLASPREAERRGSQVSFRCPEGYAVMQALIAEGVIGDFRAPDLIRFGFAPLYVRFVDVHDAAATLRRVLEQRLWDRPEHRMPAKVT